MTVSEALAFFADQSTVQTALRPLADVGLEYLRLGQPVPTLSGGEAQRLKLAGHLAEAAKRAPHPNPLPAKRGEGIEKRVGDAGNSLAPLGERAGVRGSLFLFDEPTTGLHFDDVAKLLRAFRQLIAAGNSLVVIEHNLDVIAASDWVIDLGPEGGKRGGKILVEGNPLQLAKSGKGHTAEYLKRELESILPKKK